MIEESIFADSESDSVAPSAISRDSLFALDLDGTDAMLREVQEIQRLRDPTSSGNAYRPRAQSPTTISAMAAAQFRSDSYVPPAFRIQPLVPVIKPGERHPGLKRRVAALNEIREDTIAGTPSLAQRTSTSLQNPEPQRSSTNTIVHLSSSQEARQLMDITHAQRLTQQDAQAVATQLWADHILKHGFRTQPEFLREKSTSLPAATLQLELYKKWRFAVMTEILQYDRGGVKSSHERRYEELEKLLPKLLAQIQMLGEALKNGWNPKPPGATPVVTTTTQPAPEDTPVGKAAPRAKPVNPEKPSKPAPKLPNGGFGPQTIVIPYAPKWNGVQSAKRPAESDTVTEKLTADDGPNAKTDSPQQTQSKKLKTHADTLAPTDTLSELPDLS